MLLPYSMLFLTTLLMSTLMALSATHWIFLWLSLELNMLSFIAIMHQNQKTQTTEATVKYFVIQAVGSILFLTTGISTQMLTPHPLLPPALIMLSIFMKMGAAPFHFWFPPVASSLNWNTLLILSTWQKLAPLGVLSAAMKWSAPHIPLIIAAASALAGGLGGIGQTQLRPIIAFSSIGHLGWMIALTYVNPSAMIAYFIVYVFLITPLLLVLKTINISSILNNKMLISNKEFMMMAILLLSIGGVPPFSGFILKWMSIQILTGFISPVMLAILILGSLLSLYFYLNILFSTLSITPTTPKSKTTTLTPALTSYTLTSLFFMDFLIMLM
uniref:NADH dehydrogenase subunit 2 n=1 Tax=Pseudopotamilla reniformis TaxID=279639 RepID=UPI001FB00FD4|nr:NADH dehydrogenase subunit 2 [Pseudopotamilla reniformis]ULD67142.1 NADH dehydrogenase subunit 2 [Pseudopotamilla reniformis]